MRYFFIILFIIIFISFSVVYWKISFSSPLDDRIKDKKVKLNDDKNSSILGVLSSQKITDNSFPVSELYYKIDLSREIPIKIIYRVIIDKFDKYKLFGIEQILSLNFIHYSIIKKDGSARLFINFSSKSSADRIISLMKRYKIDVKMRKLFIKG